MSAELLKALTQGFAFLIGTAFVITVIRFVFDFGKFVRKQEEMALKIEDAARAFTSFADSVSATLKQYGRDILELQIERRMENRGAAHRRTDPPDDLHP